MQFIPEIAQGISILVFAWYGMGCFLSARMETEFARYRLARFRVFIGALQVAASVGLLVGHFFRLVLLFSAGGLAIMMLLAVITRLRIRDPLFAALPALALLALNLYIVAAAL